MFIESKIVFVVFNIIKLLCIQRHYIVLIFIMSKHILLLNNNKNVKMSEISCFVFWHDSRLWYRPIDLVIMIIIIMIIMVMHVTIGYDDSTIYEKFQIIVMAKKNLKIEIFFSTFDVNRYGCLL